MVNGMGRDRGPRSALEQALLPATTADERRTWTMRGTTLRQDAGHAIGALAAGLPSAGADVDVAGRGHSAHVPAMRRCSRALGAFPIAFLDAGVEPSSPTTRQAASDRRQTRGIVRSHRDAVRARQHRRRVPQLGAGLLLFFERYGMTEAQIAGLFFAAPGC